MTEDQAPVARLQLVTFWLLVLFSLGAAFSRTPEDPLASAAGIAIAVPAAAIAVTQRRRPRTAVTLYLIAGAGVVLDAGNSHGNLGYFGLCVLAFLSVLTAGPRRGYAFAVAAIAFLCVQLARGFSAGWLPWIAGVFVSALGSGVLLHEQRLLAQLQAAQADLAMRTRLQERARIARDLHDVIAHSLTVSLLHISAARMAVRHDPADADRALAEAERLGRESLDEVRAIVGMTRLDGADGTDPDARPDLAPTPGLESLSQLIERYRSAGTQIELALDADVAAVPATIGTTAYRITQEALTNAARHAAGWPVAVRLNVPNGSVELEVFSAGPPRTPAPSGTGGHGLHTMRERAEAVGGVLQAGPAGAAAADGWLVRASLPLGPGPPPPCERWL